MTDLLTPRTTFARTGLDLGCAASDLCEYTREEVVRLTRVAAALSLANGENPLPIISVDKANVMATSRLWRQVVTETIRDEYPQLVNKLSHHLVDSAAMVLARDPRKLNGVVLTENVSRRETLKKKCFHDD